MRGVDLARFEEALSCIEDRNYQHSYNWMLHAMSFRTPEEQIKSRWYLIMGLVDGYDSIFTLSQKNDKEKIKAIHTEIPLAIASREEIDCDPTGDGFVDFTFSVFYAKVQSRVEEAEKTLRDDGNLPSAEKEALLADFADYMEEIFEALRIVLEQASDDEEEVIPETPARHSQEPELN